MILLNFLESLPIGFEAKSNLAQLIMRFPLKNLTYSGYRSIARREVIPDDYKLPENYLELMEVVNRMVKDPACPSNLKNRFYKYKERVIKECIREKRVSDVWNEGHCISLTIDGKYKFHQLAYSYASSLLLGPISGCREYKRDEPSIPFDEETYNQFLIAAVYYVGKSRFARYGNKYEPKDSYGYIGGRVKEPKPGYKNLGLFLERQNMPFSTKSAIASLLVLGKVVNKMTRQEYNEITENEWIPDTYELPRDTLRFMARVEPTMSSVECTKNMRNQYDRYKRGVIRAYLEDGKVSDIRDCGNTYDLLVDGKYRFRLSKMALHGMINPEDVVVGTEPTKQEPQAFNFDNFKTFQLSALRFIGLRSNKKK